MVQSPTTSERQHTAAKRYIYAWGAGTAEGNGHMKDLLGGKGAGLAEMTLAGLPTPPGFTITTEACNDYFANGKQLPDGLWDDVLDAMHEVERRSGKGFGDPANPLLVSVRSGAKFSMPGMMDTVLNLGLNEETLDGLIALTGNERFGWDAYRRFIAMFGRIVMDVKAERFDEPLEARKDAHGHDAKDTDLTVADLQALVDEYKQVVREDTGRDFPTDPYEQLDLAIKAVFASWFGKRANDYRNSQKIAHDLGTAVNVVTMVFGNMGDDSGTGVAFTRNTFDGTKELYGEYLTNAQGEDVVAGIRTPEKISELKAAMPDAYDEFVRIGNQLEAHYRDVQDLEFTIEKRPAVHAPDADREADRRGRREDRGPDGQRGRDHASERPSSGSSPRRSTSSSARSSTRTRARAPPRSSTGSTPRRARPWAGRCSTPTRRSNGSSGART